MSLTKYINFNQRMVKSILNKVQENNFELIDIIYAPSDNTNPKPSFHHKIKVKCDKGHESEVIAAYFKGKCAECVGKKKLDNESFSNLLDKDYELKSEYINNSTHVELLHKVCGNTFRVRPNDYMSKKNRCPFCNTNRSTQSLKENRIEATDEYIANNIPDLVGFDENYIVTNITTSIYNIFVRKKYMHQCKRLEYNPPVPVDQFKECLSANGYILIDSIDGLFIDNDKTKYTVMHKECGHTYKVSYNKFVNQSRRCPECSKGKKFSNDEKELLKYIESLNIEVIPNYRELIPDSRKEVDIYVPKLNIGIEYNGLYWHSEGMRKDKYDMSNKTDLFSDNNIRLIHILSSEWQSKKDIVKSRIKSILRVNDINLYARKCVIKNVNTQDAKIFLNKNHIQGSNIGDFMYAGLYYNEELVSVMSFCKPRLITNTNKLDRCVELSRFAIKLNTNVVGGFSKLLKYSLKYLKELEYIQIYSYADRRWSNGNVYLENGFTLESISKPSYYYFKNDSEMFHRSKFMKHKLKDLLVWYDENLTEYQNMSKHGYRRIWDCGNYKFIMSI